MRNKSAIAKWRSSLKVSPGDCWGRITRIELLPPPCTCKIFQPKRMYIMNSGNLVWCGGEKAIGGISDKLKYPAAFVGRHGCANLITLLKYIESLAEPVSIHWTSCNTLGKTLMCVKKESEWLRTPENFLWCLDSEGVRSGSGFPSNQLCRGRKIEIEKKSHGMPNIRKENQSQYHAAIPFLWCESPNEFEKYGSSPMRGLNPQPWDICLRVSRSTDWANQAGHRFIWWKKIR